MLERLKIPYPIIVEGRYDRIRVERVADTQIIETSGFGIFRDEDKRALLKVLSAKTQLIVLTDSDRAGQLIRSHLHGYLHPDCLIEVYIPQIAGQEKRKKNRSADGYLGVEGMEEDLLYQLLKPYEQADTYNQYRQNPLNKADLYEDGLTGQPNSSEKRDELAVRLGLPRGMTPNAFMEAIKILMSYEDYLVMVGREHQDS